MKGVANEARLWEKEERVQAQPGFSEAPLVRSDLSGTATCIEIVVRELRAVRCCWRSSAARKPLVRHPHGANPVSTAPRLFGNQCEPYDRVLRQRLFALGFQGHGL